MIEVDVYPVGLLRDIKRKRVRHALRHYLWRQVKARNWRAARNYFNGYLAEHRDCWHSAGHAWTQATAVRHAEMICLRHEIGSTS